MGNSINLRPDTIRELRAALAENALPKYITRRLGRASQVHSVLPDPDGERHLVLKTSGIFSQFQADVGLDDYEDEGDVSAQPSEDLRETVASRGRVNELCKGHIRPLLDIARDDAASHWLQRNGHGDPHPPNEPHIICGSNHAVAVCQPDLELDPEREPRQQPSAADISRADEAARFLSLIPDAQRVIRRCLCLAIRLDIYTGKPRHSWSAIAQEIGANKSAIGPWIHQGIAIIAEALKDKLNALGYTVRKPNTTETNMDFSKPTNPDSMLTRKETSEAIKYYFDLDISYATLTTYAFKGTGPLFYKPTGKVFYKWSDVCEWIVEQSKPRRTTRQLAMA